MSLSLRETLAAGVAFFALIGSCATVALPTISLSTSNALTYQRGVTGQTLQVDFKVSLAEADPNLSMIQLSNFVAYNPDFLMFKSIVWGNAMDSTNLATHEVGYFNYTDVGTLAAGIPPSGTLGTPVDMGTDTYYDGSLNVDMSRNVTGFVLADLYNKQHPGPALLFSIVFNVVTTQLGNSAIILLNDQSFNPVNSPEFDAKYLASGTTPTTFYPESNFLNVIVTDAPAPAPLVLIATGLLGMAARRRGVR